MKFLLLKCKFHWIPSWRYFKFKILLNKEMKSFKNNIIFLSFFVKIFIYKSYKGKWEKVIYNPLHLLVEWCVLILLCSIRKLYVSNLYARMSRSVCPSVCRFSKNSTCFANRLETAKNDAIQNSSLPKLVIVYILNFLAFLRGFVFLALFFLLVFLQLTSKILKSSFGGDILKDVYRPSENNVCD